MSGRCCSHGAAVAATAAALRWWLSTATIARISGEPHNCIVLPSLETHFSVSLDIYLLGKYTHQSTVFFSHQTKTYLNTGGGVMILHLLQRNKQVLLPKCNENQKRGALFSFKYIPNIPSLISDLTCLGMDQTICYSPKTHTAVVVKIKGYHGLPSPILILHYLLHTYIYLVKMQSSVLFGFFPSKETIYVSYFIQRVKSRILFYLFFCNIICMF